MDPCTESEKLSAYHDGELSEVAQRRLAAHLGLCPACRDELAALRRLSALLAAEPCPALSPDILAQMREPAQWYAPRLMIRTAGALTAAAAVVLLGVLLWAHATGSTVAAAPASAWENLAISGRADSTWGDAAQTQLAQWVAADLEQKD